MTSTKTFSEKRV